MSVRGANVRLIPSFGQRTEQPSSVNHREGRARRVSEEVLSASEHIGDRQVMLWMSEN